MGLKKGFKFLFVLDGLLEMEGYSADMRIDGGISSPAIKVNLFLKICLAIVLDLCFRSFLPHGIISANSIKKFQLRSKRI